MSCEAFNCTRTPDCFCFKQETADLVHKTATDTMINPQLLVFEICLYDKRVSYHGRTLLENGRATFTNHNLTIAFEDPILRLPDLGKVIIRTSDFEHVISVSKDLKISLPFPTEIEIIYLHPRGYTATGIIHVNGKSTCKLRQCLLCTEVFSTVACWSRYMQVFFYGLLVFLLALIIICVKILTKSILWFLVNFFLDCKLCIHICNSKIFPTDGKCYWQRFAELFPGGARFS